MPVSDSESAKCRTLTPVECDQIFFPGSGGKPTKAKVLCGTCPLKKECLIEAIENGLDGFFAGTTPSDRRVMNKHWHRKVVTVTEIIVATLPKSEQDRQRKDTRRVYRRVPVAQPDTLDYLDSLRGPAN